ncbi:tetratricopeptide repeat protein [Bacillus sp. B-jedd]|uniref:tetratricopeptide repeat protein n=1 Tax=Bacillus sp. B-jedd TaxID=1476857 RepID=UPI0005155E92|nr:tetratricopeptide repeat protein [Bacillus sp. B-jedd]CEG25456.1 hypothetical protein BN1002_00267 [Bacillus sp. B-jedd]
MNKIGRNELCTCGSGKKFKKCCMGKEMAGTVNSAVQNGGLLKEQLLDMIERGEEYLNHNDSVSACDVWLQAWEVIKVRNNPAYKNLKFLDRKFSDKFFIKNFVQDLELELYHAGKKDNSYFEKRIDYCREFCEIFPEEDELIIHNMRRAIGDSYAILGQYEEAAAEFEKLVKDFPNNPWGYIGWGDIYFYEQKKDYQKARQLYDKALEIAKDKDEILAVEERLEELKRVI